MLDTLQKRYFFFALLLAGGSLLIMSVLLIWSIDRNFGAYLSDQQEQQVLETAASIEASYVETGTLDAVPPMLGSMQDHVMIRLYDADGDPVTSGGDMMHDGMHESAEEQVYELEAEGG